jgi:hypothetical protein
MKKPTSHHRVEVGLREINQLFNSLDPTPFNEKDLDQNAEDFIVSWVQEYPINEPVQLMIHLDQWPDYDPKSLITDTIHHYFSYRAKMTHLELGRLFKQGRTSLLIGSSFMITCILIIKFTLSEPNQTAWTSVIRESLTIAGWVAMWRPMQIYLYDWWPMRRKEKIFSKLSVIPVEIAAKRHGRKH